MSSDTLKAIREAYAEPTTCVRKNSLRTHSDTATHPAQQPNLDARAAFRATKKPPWLPRAGCYLPVVGRDQLEGRPGGLARCPLRLAPRLRAPPQGVERAGASVPVETGGVAVPPVAATGVDRVSP
jgi:hypothetical protein